MSPNGIHYAAFGDTGIDDLELARMVQAVPTSVAAALAGKIYYFVPLALAEGRSAGTGGHRSGKETTMISPVYSADLVDLADLPSQRGAAAGRGLRAREVFHLHAAAE